MEAKIKVVSQNDGLFLVQIWVNGKLFDVKVLNENELKEFGLK